MAMGMGMMGTGTMPPGGAPPVPGGGAGLSAMLSRLTMPAGGPPTLRPVPGQDGPSTDFYDRLAAEDRDAEKTVRERFSRIRKESLEGREQIEAAWWRYLLYINGRQWIFHNQRNGWQDKRLARWIPRPVTNICAETVQTVRSMLSGIEVSGRARPAGPDPLHTITAKIVDDIEPVLRAEHRMQEIFFEADFWAPAVGCVWLHSYWDRDNPANQEFIQAVGCPECGYAAHPLDVEDGVVPGCPDCGRPANEFQPLTEPGTNTPMGQNEIIGAGATECVSPLEILIPMHFQRWAETTELIRLRWRPKSYYEGRPYANLINYRSTPADRSLQLYRSLASMTDLTTSPLQGTGTYSGSSEGAIEAEMWVKPNAQYPDGLWARFVGGVSGDSLLIRDEERGVVPGPLPQRDVKGRVMWPWFYYPFEQRGGKLWGISVLEPVIQKQDQINRNDSMVELIMQRMANPVWLEPKGSEVQRFTGEPGLIVRYATVAGSNAKPERIEGVSVQQSFFQLRDQYRTDAERASGTQDVMKGSNPSGMTAFSALNLLVERSQSRFTSLFKVRGLMYRDWLSHALELERVHGPQVRVKTVVGENNTYTFETLKKADLMGSVEIIIEDGSETPKTSLGKRAAIQQAKELGILNTTDPDAVYKGLDLLGIADMQPGLSIHTTSAQTEHHRYEEWVAGNRQGPNPLKVESWQNHVIHKAQLDLWANSDKMRDLTLNDKLVAAEVTYHRLMHDVAMQNPFNIPASPIAPPMPGPGGPAAPGGPPAVAGAGAPPPMMPPEGGPLPPQGADMALANSNQESNATDTLPGAAPGGGNMGAPA